MAATPFHARVAYAALGGGSTPVWVAQEAGIFNDEGIEAEVILVRGSQAVTEALLAGEIQFANIAAPAVVQADLRGADIRYLTGGINTLVQTLIVRPDIQRVEDLRGRRIGATSAGDVDDYVAQVLFKPYGLRLGEEVQRVRIHDQPDALKRLEAGEIEGGIFSPPYQFVALKRGFKPLVNAADLGLEYQLGGIIARQAFIDANPELTRRFVRAYVRGIHRCRTDLDFTVGVLCKYSHLEDEEVARESARWQDHCFQPKPYPTIKGLQTILRQLSEREPAARTASADAMTDMRWLRELDETGFFDALYQESAHV